MSILFDQIMTGAEIAFNDGSNNETWAYDTELGDTGSDLYTVAESFIAWGNHASRGWSGTLTFTYAITKIAPNHGLTLTVAGGPGAWTTNSAASEKLRLPSGTTATGSGGGSLSSTGGIASTLSFSVALRNWRTIKGQAGCVSYSGSWQHDPIHARPNTASARSVVTHSQLYALTLATAQASTPRRANMYDTITSAYRRVFVAEIKTNMGEKQIHKVSFAVIEDA